MSELSSPMKTPWSNEGNYGGKHPGDKDSVAVGRPSGSGSLATSLNNPWPTPDHNRPSTAGGPVGIQVTEDVQGASGMSAGFPRGTEIRKP